jgi:hypothetical protein
MLRGWIIPSAHNLLQLLSAHRNNVRLPSERERVNILGEGIVRLGHQQLQQQSILLLVGWKSCMNYSSSFLLDGNHMTCLTQLLA